MKTIKILELDNGKSPYLEWVRKQNPKTRTKINDYVFRLSQGGSKKNVKSLGDKLFELKINYGPGYRVYFAETDNVIILIINGGNKSTQKDDIKKARMYWSKYGL